MLLGLVPLIEVFKRNQRSAFRWSRLLKFSKISCTCRRVGRRCGTLGRIHVAFSLSQVSSNSVRVASHHQAFLAARRERNERTLIGLEGRCPPARGGDPDMAFDKVRQIQSAFDLDLGCSVFTVQEHGSLLKVVAIDFELTARGGVSVNGTT